MIDRLKQQCCQLKTGAILAECGHCKSQIYQWRKGIMLDRKKRDPKQFDEKAVENAASVVTMYPHFSGRKGQAFMLYHQMGYISMNAYDAVKKDVKKVLSKELSKRAVTPSKDFYDHIQPTKVGQIWSEDFTELPVNGVTFKLAILIDVFDQYILGTALAIRATAKMVEQPVHQALEFTSGKGPELFLLSDNGKQYISEEHNRLLDSIDIVHRCIPSCKPQYNGSVECGIKEFKNVFYNVWESLERKGADKEKKLRDRVDLGVAEAVRHLNEIIPRPALGGVTPLDVHAGQKPERKEVIKKYYEKESAKMEFAPWNRNYWNVLTDGIGATIMSTKELLTKMAFFIRKPLRRIAQINKECVG